MQHCGEPPSIKNGRYRVLHSPDNHFELNGIAMEGTKIYYYCDNGFTIVNHADLILTCTQGDWTGRLPNCMMKYPESNCAQPPSIANGYFSMYTPSGTFGGTKAIYFCYHGYKPHGSTTISCLNQKWVGSPPACVMSKGCTHPPALLHGDYNFFGSSDADSEGLVAEGSQVYYYCHSGYKIESLNASAVLECRDERWIGNMPKCGKLSIGSSYQCKVSLQIIWSLGVFMLFQ